MLLTEKDEVEQISSLSDEPLPLHRTVLMSRPDFFEVLYVKNPHMEGNIGAVDAKTALKQWTDVKQKFENLGLKVELLDAVEGLEDMVFTANQALPFLDQEGRKKVIPAKMYAKTRAGEVAHCVEWFTRYGYEPINLNYGENEYFEGMGDALWHRGQRLLLASYGYRSTLGSLADIAANINLPVAAFKLVDPRFYHLDTCLSVLDEESALVYPGAFEEGGLELLAKLFPRILRVSEEDAAGSFVCNAFCPDNKHVVIQRGATETNKMLKENGFIPVEVDTAEFMKSGGSVFCMKVGLW